MTFCCCFPFLQKPLRQLEALDHNRDKSLNDFSSLFIFRMRNHFLLFETAPAVIIERLTEPAVMADWRTKVTVLVQHCSIAFIFLFHLIASGTKKTNLARICVCTLLKEWRVPAYFDRHAWSLLYSFGFSSRYFTYKLFLNLGGLLAPQGAPIATTTYFSDKAAPTNFFSWHWSSIIT